LIVLCITRTAQQRHSPEQKITNKTDPQQVRSVCR